jgi:ribosomal protein S18 acetylase RimI-like enzyme
MSPITSLRIRTAVIADADRLARLAALTFPLACPPHTTDAAKAAFIDEVLSPARFREYLADPARVLLLADPARSAGRADAARPSGRADPARTAAEPAGYTMLVDGDPADAAVRATITVRPTIELSKCYVHPDHHGQGVADALLEASLDVGRSRHAAGMWLGVNNENARAQRFYQRHGFVVVGTKHFRVGDRLEDDFVLERPL